MDLAFLKDKKVQLAAGAGAVLGLIVLAKKKGGASGGQTSSTTGTAGTLGTYTDNGMDAYQNLNNELEGGLAGFQTQITSIQDQLSRLQPNPGTTSGSGKLTAHQAHALHVQHVKNKTPAKPAHRPGLDAHQLHAQHVKNKGPAPKRRR